MSRILFLTFTGLVLCASQAMADVLKISVIGAGNVGGTLGTLWVKAGHSVMFSSRHPEELTDLVNNAGPSARAGSVSEAAAWGDVIVLRANSTGRRNTLIEVFMGRPAGWMQKLTGRGAMRSPGAPSLRNEIERLFWVQIATGITSEKAAQAVGVSTAVGTRWFRHRGGMPLFMSNHISGRYLSFAEREEIGLLRAQSVGVREMPVALDEAHRQFHGS